MLLPSSKTRLYTYSAHSLVNTLAAEPLSNTSLLLSYQPALREKLMVIKKQKQNILSKRYGISQIRALLSFNYNLYLPCKCTATHELIPATN
jgi:hypothetical protein